MWFHVRGCGVEAARLPRIFVLLAFRVIGARATDELRSGLVRRGEARRWCGKSWLGCLQRPVHHSRGGLGEVHNTSSYGESRLGLARHGETWQGRFRQGWSRHGEAVCSLQPISNGGLGEAHSASRSGMARRGDVRSGLAGHGGVQYKVTAAHGEPRQGPARHGMARVACNFELISRSARRGTQTSRSGMAGYGEVRRGEDGCGMAGAVNSVQHSRRERWAKCTALQLRQGEARHGRNGSG